jgi:hypothetical protein
MLSEIEHTPGIRQCLRKDERSDLYRSHRKPRETPQSDHTTAGGRALLCNVCGHAITRTEAAIEVTGKHLHTFFNPAGVLFEIECFAAAPGCHDEGQPTDFFSWFPDCRWRYSYCAKCYHHLGWQFLPSSGPAFWGLIQNLLVEGDVPEGEQLD